MLYLQEKGDKLKMRSEKFKISQYNLIMKNTNNETLLYNSLSKKCIKISQEHSKEIIELLEGKRDINPNSPYFNELYDMGYIVNYTVDEVELVDYQYYKMAYSDELMELTIVPTNACNFNCIYCYQKNGKDFMTNEVKEKILKFIERNIYRYKRLYVNWFGGEALLLKDTVLEMTERMKIICRKNKVSFIGRITTNGYELDLQTFKALFNNNVLLYSITIDGVQHIHDKQRPHKNGKSSYERIISNLKRIKEEVKSRNFTIDLRTNISKSSIVYMDQFLEEYIKIFGQDKRFNLVLESVHDWKGEKIKQVKNEVIEEVDEITYWHNEALKKNIKTQNFMKYQLNTHICVASKKNGYIIDWNGTFHKCDMAMYDEIFSEMNKIGKLDNTGVLHIDEEKEARWLIRGDINNNCKKCLGYPYCMGVQCIYGKKFLNIQRCQDTIAFIKWSVLRMGAEKYLKTI
jgi:uncharacterized protein